MITEQGIIETLSGQKAIVRIKKSSACAACQCQESCSEVSERDMIVEVANDIEAREGDRVEISIASGSFLILSLLIYLVPVTALIAGAIAGNAFAPALNLNPTLASIVGGFLGVAIAFFVLKRIDRSSRAQRQFGPRMTRIVLRSAAPHSENHPE
jgi:sigma-E factor negative regulatory protein RseC